MIGTAARALSDTLLTMAPFDRVRAGRKAWVTA